MVKEIKSKDNPIYKKLTSLKSAACARKNQLIAVEGPRHTLDVLDSGFVPELIFFSDDGKGREACRLVSGALAAKGVQMEEGSLVRLPVAMLDRASSQKTPQGVIALFPYRTGQLGLFLERPLSDFPSCRLLILEAVQDPGNVGTLIRTADAFALDGVILTDSCASVWNPKTIAASMGSLFHIPLMEVAGGLDPTLILLKKAGFELLASGLEGEDLAEAETFRPRLALILGNEGSGLSSGALEHADRVLRVPMPGRAESLNVASAGAILLWELARQRSSRGASMV